MPQALAQEVANYLGMDLGGITIKRFADGEIYVQVQESVRGCDVFLIQPTAPPVNDSLMELLVMIDACKRASARSVTAVIPYYGYARADRKVQVGLTYHTATVDDNEIELVVVIIIMARMRI